ncbi:MAG: leucine-rich repeat protein [Prevotella sp.]|nr:leucine-rich repeat protein [Prevotella sp.]
MPVPTDNTGSSVSAYMTESYEGLDRAFSEVSALPSRSYCDLYRAKRYGRWYLLKCLKQEHAADAVYQQLLRKEIEVLMRLQHPGVMQAVGMETVVLPGRGSVTCVVAEWIDGMTLAEYLKSNPPLKQLRRIALELAEALAYVHQQQVVHRDVKPSNVMITHNGGYVKLIDFGLADTDSHTILKQPAGTLRYMAPEQAHLAQADVRNDIYSLGIILQEMNGLGRVVPRRIVNRCLAPIEHRWQNTEALVDALKQSSRRRRWLYIGAALALVAFIVGLLVWQIRHLQQKADDMESNATAMSRQLRILRHEIIDFDDPEVKRKCIAHWDTDHDGELSYDEAAAVTSLDSVFTADRSIASFHELQFFTGLEAIGRDAFHGCTSLRQLTLPRHVRFIQQNAFRGSGLQMLTVPSSVVGIGDHCLDDCPVLQAVVFEAMLPATNVGVSPLQGCTALSDIFVQKYIDISIKNRVEWEVLRPLMKTHIVFADAEVKAICLKYWDKNGDGELQIDEAQAVTNLNAAFCRNPVIEHFDELRFFTGLHEIGIGDFDHCLSLRSIQLPVTITSIRAWAFNRCLALEHIDLPERLQTIEHDAFINSGLHSIFIPAATTSIATTAVTACEQLTIVVVSPDNPVYDSRDSCNAIIETQTNMMVSGSAAATIPRSVTSLSDECFNFFNPKELTIPAQITRIGPWSLATYVQRLYLESPVPPAYDSQGGQLRLIEPPNENDPYPDMVIYVPAGSAEAYRQAEGWSALADYIEEYQ